MDLCVSTVTINRLVIGVAVVVVVVVLVIAVVNFIVVVVGIGACSGRRIIGAFRLCHK